MTLITDHHDAQGRKYRRTYRDGILFWQRYEMHGMSRHLVTVGIAETKQLERMYRRLELTMQPPAPAGDPGYRSGFRRAS